MASTSESRISTVKGMLLKLQMRLKDDLWKTVVDFR